MTKFRHILGAIGAVSIVINPLAAERQAEFPPAMRPLDDAALLWQDQDPAAFRSDIVSPETPGHAVDIEVNIEGARSLILEVDDGGDGIGCDWANWIEPLLIDADGNAIPLTELEWASAIAGYGEVRINANSGGGAMIVDGEEIEFGIGTHSHSEITYLLPEGHDFVTFSARAGLDRGGVVQGCGSTVRFVVYVAGGDDAGFEQPVRNSRDPGDAVRQLDVAAGLDVQLFASEPMMTNPTNIDIDHKGRVWIADVQNYRGRDGTRPEGDRILTLEDTTGDGKADKVTTFYQGNDIDSALGVTVLGNRVIVPSSPNVFVFFDDNGDGKADRKEILFSDTGIPQHDHSAHQFVFGPDGKLYWNFGDTGHHVHDADGNIIVDLFGNEVRDTGQPYRNGMAFRHNLDGSEFEVLGHNFRNPYGLTVDSFGRVWQSDNDDDGNRACRINFILEYGNYGYSDELTGAGWRQERIGMHPEIPLRHWHVNDPGSVPNLLDTGSGSPSEIIFYEGDLLPPPFRNTMIHAEPGHNVLRAYPFAASGAGYTAQIADLLKGSRDNWFRPVATGVAPDGSIFVADWYDPGVGGHGMGDIERGRIFRIAPEDHAYQVPEYEFSTAEGAAEALKSPNQAVRYLAWTSLNGMGRGAEPVLREMYESDDPRFAARALWLLSKIDGYGPAILNEAITHEDPNIRMTAIRAARQIDVDVLDYVEAVLDDSSPGVRREALIALHRNENDRAAGLWAELARHHTYGDRWYVEALGIAAEGQWEAFFDAWLDSVDGRWNTNAGREIVWRSRAPGAAPMLGEIIVDPATPSDRLPRYFRALDFHRAEDRRPVLVSLLGVTGDRADAIAGMALGQIGSVNLEQEPAVRRAVEQALERADAGGALRLIERFELREHADRLIEPLVEYAGRQVGVRAARLLMSWEQEDLIEQRIAEEESAVEILGTLGMTGTRNALRFLERITMDSGRDQGQRAAAVNALGRTQQGQAHLLEIVKTGGLPGELHFTAANVLHDSVDGAIREEAGRWLTMPGTREDEPLPPVSELVTRRGDTATGEMVYRRSCLACHQVHGEGINFGPDLSEIGDKLSREGMYSAILDPNSSIGFNYRGVIVALDDGSRFQGYITSETDDTLTINQMGGISVSIAKSEITERAVMEHSLMPAGLQRGMTEDELVALVEYLTTLRAD